MTAARALSLLLVLMASGTPAAAQQAESSSGPDPLRGRFVALGGQLDSGRAACVQCHGLSGLGDGSGAVPRLAGLDGWTLYKALRDYAVGLRRSGIMGPVAAGLSDREMQDVAAHYAGFSGLPYDPPADVAAADRQLGAALVAVGAPDRGLPACSSCHGPAGSGAGIAFPRIAGQYAPYLRHQLLKWRDGSRDGDPMNAMERVAKSLTEEDIRRVSLYLAAVDPHTVRPPPAAALPGPSTTPAEPPWLGTPAEEDAPR